MCPITGLAWLPLRILSSDLLMVPHIVSPNYLIKESLTHERHKPRTMQYKCLLGNNRCL